MPLIPLLLDCLNAKSTAGNEYGPGEAGGVA